MNNLVTTYLSYVPVLLLLVVFSASSPSYGEAQCQSETDCALLCDQYEEFLNEDDKNPYEYQCSITGYQEVLVIEGDGTTTGHTEYNCICTVIRIKGDDDEDADEPGGTRPETPVVIKPIIPDKPGGVVPPDNKFVECIKNAKKWSSEHYASCNSDFQSSPASERFFKAFELINCRHIVDDARSKELKRCHKTYGKRAIRKLKPLGSLYE